MIIGELEVDEKIDSDKELGIAMDHSEWGHESIYLTVEEIEKLRDHLNCVLADNKTDRNVNEEHTRNSHELPCSTRVCDLGSEFSVRVEIEVDGKKYSEHGKGFKKGRAVARALHVLSRELFDAYPPEV